MAGWLRNNKLWCVMVLASFAVALGMWWLSASEYQLNRELFMCRVSGYLAVGNLVSCLAVTPCRRLWALFGIGRVQPSTWLAFRRAFGISAALCAVLHSGLVFTLYLGEAPWFVAFLDPFYRAGLGALIVLLLLLATSFPRVVQMLRIRYWRVLHWLVYLAGVLVLQHLALSPFAELTWVLWLCGGGICLAAGRLLPFDSTRS